MGSPRSVFLRTPRAPGPGDFSGLAAARRREVRVGGQSFVVGPGDFYAIAHEAVVASAFLCFFSFFLFFDFVCFSPRGFHERPAGGCGEGFPRETRGGGRVRGKNIGNEKTRVRGVWGRGFPRRMDGSLFGWISFYFFFFLLLFFPASSRAPPHVSLCIFLGRWSCIAGILSCPKPTFRPFDFPISVHFQMGCEK